MKAFGTGNLKALIKAAAVVTTAALFSGGCGDSDSPAVSRPADATLSKAAFVSRADQICARADKEQLKTYADYQRKHPNAQQSPAGQTRLLTQAALPPMKQEMDELDAIGLPKVETAEAEAILRGFRKALEEVEADPRAVVDGEWPFTAAEKKAQEFGFGDCAQPG